MNLQDLKLKAELIIQDIKDKGCYLKENSFIDYKAEVNIKGEDPSYIQFMRNFAKDILSFANKNGGILFLGFKENKTTGTIMDAGLTQKNISFLESIDLKDLSDQFRKVVDHQINLDMREFNMVSNKFYYIIIEKHNSILVPKKDFLDFDLKKGEVFYRGSANNIRANENTSLFNNFIEMKVNEKNQEFMKIWSSVLPEVFDINPKEIVIINPSIGRIYGYNQKNKILESAGIDIDYEENGAIRLILNAISAGEIGKITSDEGKPIYRLVGDLKVPEGLVEIQYHNLKSKDFIINYFTYINQGDIEIIKIIDSLNFQPAEYFPVYGYSKIHTSDNMTKRKSAQRKNIEEYLSNKTKKNMPNGKFTSIDEVIKDDRIKDSYKMYAITNNVYKSNITLEECYLFIKEKLEKNKNISKVDTDIRRLLCVYDIIKYS